MSNPDFSSRLQCTECDFNTGKVKKLEKHMRKCHTGRFIRCPWCVGGHYSSSPEALSIHKKQQHRAVRLRCFLCQFSTRNLLRWAGHLSQIHARAVASSLVCVASSERKAVGLPPEDQTQTGQNLSSAAECQEENSWKGHEKSSNDIKDIVVEHSNGCWHKCKFCDYTAKTPSVLKRHIITVHSSERPFKCPHCDYAAKHKRTLKVHIRIHTNEHPYKCPYCDYAAKQKHYLKFHLIDHTNERPFKCSFCDHASKNMAKFKRHLLTHTNERPHKCSLCDHAFKSRMDLKRHISFHTNERPYKCSFCDYAANLKYTLTIHIRRRHTGTM